MRPGAKARRFLRLLFHPAVSRKLGTLVTDGYLAESGWVRSWEEGTPVDAAGAPVPWMTAPFVDFLLRRLQPTWDVFEFGAGASTRFFASRVNSVTAVEHDAEFAARLQRRLPDNARLLCHPETSDEYIRAFARHAPPVQLLSVDGRRRDECLAQSLAALSPGGVIVLDDSQRAEYAPARRALVNAGFRELEFWGLAPLEVARRCTSLFYRSENVVGL